MYILHTLCVKVCVKDGYRERNHLKIQNNSQKDKCAEYRQISRDKMSKDKKDNNPENE